MNRIDGERGRGPRSLSHTGRSRSGHSESSPVRAPRWWGARTKTAERPVAAIGRADSDSGAFFDHRTARIARFHREERPSCWAGHTSRRPRAAGRTSWGAPAGDGVAHAVSPVMLSSEGAASVVLLQPRAQNHHSGIGGSWATARPQERQYKRRRGSCIEAPRTRRSRTMIPRPCHSSSSRWRSRGPVAARATRIAVADSGPASGSTPDAGTARVRLVADSMDTLPSLAGRRTRRINSLAPAAKPS